MAVFLHKDIREVHVKQSEGHFYLEVPKQMHKQHIPFKKKSLQKLAFGKYRAMGTNGTFTILVNNEVVIYSVSSIRSIKLNRCTSTALEISLSQPSPILHLSFTKTVAYTRTTTKFRISQEPIVKR